MDMQTLTEKLVARKDGAIGWIVFNNPQKHNAVSLEMWEALPMVLGELAKDAQIRVVILKGEGEKAFISGADISQFKEKRGSAEAVQTYNAASDRAGRALNDFPKPLIAMIRGYCIGGGLGVAAACDLRIVSDNSRFGVPAAKLGLGYRHSGIKRLAELVGPSFTAEIFYTGRQFDASEALQMGLVNRVLPVADLEKYVLDYAMTIINNAPMTIAAVKRSLLEIRKDPGERDLELCQKMVEDCFASEDYAEGRTAFMEKRKPVFKGR
ncbi:MAG: enoyl-CoA hydratase [Pseudomonadota bacterium]